MTYIVIEEHEYADDTIFTVFKTFDEAKRYIVTINPEEDESLIGVHIAELNTSIKIRDKQYSISDKIDELKEE